MNEYEIEARPVMFDERQAAASRLDVMEDIRKRAATELAKQRESVLYDLLVKAGVPAPIHPPSLTGELFRCALPDGSISWLLGNQKLANFRPVTVETEDGVYRACQRYSAA